MVADQLEASLVNQQQVLEGQQSSLSNQGEILRNEAYLKSALKTSAESAKEAFLDMKQATAQQKAVLMETFDSLFKGVDRITKLQSMLLGEFMTLHSLGFYLVSILACYIITSAPRTAAARLWLFGVLSAHIVIERLIVRWNITDKESQQSGTTTEVIHGQLWIFRKIFVFECFLILTYFATKYCDYGKINYSMLRDIQIELRKLKYKGTDIGKCITDGINRSFALEETFSYSNKSAVDYPTLYPMVNLDETCLSEEDLYTDDSSDSNGRESSSGSESEDPTFVLDTSQRPLVDNPLTLSTSCADRRSQVNEYNLRPRKAVSYQNDENGSMRCLPDPKTLSDLIFNLTRSAPQHSKTRRRPRLGKTATFSARKEIK